MRLLNVQPALRLICSIAVLSTTIGSKAQHAGVVFDMETKRPISGVNIYINPKGSVHTDSKGNFIITQPCNSVTFSHASYESRSYCKDELCDTIWLMPKLNRLDEVIITAQGPKIGVNKYEVSKYARQFKNTDSGFSFDLSTFLDFKKNKQAKRRKRLEKILRDY